MAFQRCRVGFHACELPRRSESQLWNWAKRVTMKTDLRSMLTARDFERASTQRFTAAEFLLNRGFTLDALYLAGYAVECVLKALIMHLTPEANREETFRRLSSGAKMHRFENLKEELTKLGRPMPIDVVKRLRRFPWSTNLRYESRRRPPGEVRGYLKAAAITIDWVKGEMK